jgi:hypothetical protein
MPLSEEARNLLEPYLDATGRVMLWPSKKQGARRTAILEFFADSFEPGREYSEIEVNQVLNGPHTFEDPAYLRRELVDRGLIQRTRDGRKYWRESD